MGFYGTPHNGVLIQPWHNEITYIFEGISIYYGMEIFPGGTRWRKRSKFQTYSTRPVNTPNESS